MENLGKAIFEHYEKYLGEMIGADSYPEINLQLMGYQDAVQNCLTFATMGLSLHEESLGCCCEAVLTVDQDLDACAGIFVQALKFILSAGLPMGPGLAINGLPQEFVEDHRKTAIYFTEATMFTPGFREVGEKCRIFMAFFITPEEEAYLSKHGPARLEELLEKEKADVIDLDRKSVCAFGA